MAVWTDFGGVLTPPIAHTMAVFCRSQGLDPDVLGQALGKVAARYGTTDVMEPIDTPLVSEEEWLRQVSKALEADHGVTGVRLTTLADAWFDGRETNLAWVAELRKARARGAFVGLLSNMVPAWDAHWRRMLDWTELFDDVLLSFEAGHRKPSPRMFALAAERAGVPADRCVLIDDLAYNCAGAEAAGWHAIHFTDTTEAAERLGELLSPAPGRS
ncbi:HAD family phosphatase [Streptomyces sp. S1A]|uniref:HAD family hydrolase n=1 Tax=Streptomyces chitinivorans TaxID=1257027 RepID=A0ABW7HYT9_9ACTN|nr:MULTISPECIES: HAD family phosphatase [Streptomyces]MCG3041319.1 HAD family phosphatase [Streptomyces sp. ICN903]MDH2411569.1 HAD family phosphatase [Streptomyces chitinivorans]